MSSNPTAPTAKLTAQRTQYRVGHGGFHATIVEDSASGQHLVYVYDVGACPDVALLEGAIERFVGRLASRGIQRIQYVILSHIDDDHVCRLDHLLDRLSRKKITVETLILPWLRNTSRLLALSRAPRRGPSTVVYQLLQDDDSVVRFATSLGVENVLFIEGEPNDDTDGASGNNPGLSTPRSHSGKAGYARSGVQLQVPTGIHWQMVITHLEPPKKTLRVFDQTVRKSTGLDPADQKDHAKLIENHRPQIRAAMRRAAKITGLALRGATVSNWSSQSLYSASPTPLVRHIVPHAPEDFEMDCVHGWLHTGDLPLHVPAIWDAFRRAWDRNLPGVEVCAVLAPHHGAAHGHNDELYARFNPSVVIFPLGLWRGSQRGTPKFAKWIRPKRALFDVRKRRSIKVRLLNNRV